MSVSDHHTSPLRPEGEDLLQVSSALGSLLRHQSPPHLPPSQPAESTKPISGTQTPPESIPTPTSPESSVSAAGYEAWKVEYETQVAEWRRQSATVRARAETERARWEERKAHEREAEEEEKEEGREVEGEERRGLRADRSVTDESASTSEWEAVSRRSTLPPITAASPLQLGDARSSGGEGQGTHSHPSQVAHPQSILPVSASFNVPLPTSAPSAPSVDSRGVSGPVVVDPSDSPHWENVPSSPTSSFPSMSFPEPSRPHSPERSHAPRTVTAPRPPTAASATLAVFDDSLPTRTRLWALVSSVSINMLLPFVNGVMLGFGEIFAKTVIVGWLGWGSTIATNVGLGVRSTSGRR
ncbi:hypothetical protein B0F90DRAFT_1816012 [Multifurca ochricompacta]|uniref:Uncharacterized protein n=1 Tax=Multifurca ochricompacta TaxID=376703 RepID=A0AAD4QNM3_9AGAM|nr:hypothetical protein B0F90DRAFT_1816012 [Multifurca ochricompacta]